MFFIVDVKPNFFKKDERTSSLDNISPSIADVLIASEIIMSRTSFCCFTELNVLNTPNISPDSSANLNALSLMISSS
jgi:hypothetical protein